MLRLLHFATEPCEHLSAQLRDIFMHWPQMPGVNTLLFARRLIRKEEGQKGAAVAGAAGAGMRLAARQLREARVSSVTPHDAGKINMGSYGHEVRSYAISDDGSGSGGSGAHNGKGADAEVLRISRLDCQV